MGEPFKDEAWRCVWDSLSSADKDAVRYKARWEHITLAAALKWVYPDAWQEVVQLSEACA